MKEILIKEIDEGKRVDKYVRKVLNEAPLSFIYKLFRIKDVKINNKKVDISYILKAGDILRIYVSDDQLKEFSKTKPIENIKSNLNIIYEDENILIVNKPRGILIHGDENEKRLTLANQVLNYLYNKHEYDPNNKAFTPGPAHRLDRNTSGLVIFGKKVSILQELYDLFKERDALNKYYLALVNGKLKKQGEINASLEKDENKGIVKVSTSNKAKTAITKYKVQETFMDKTLLEAELITGRTHQLRVHFAYINHPICGDSKYGDFTLNKIFEKNYNFHDQFLHAYKISFKEIHGKLSYLSNKTFVAPLDKDEKRIIEKLKEENLCI